MEAPVEPRRVRHTFSTLADDWDDKNTHIEGKVGVSNRMTTVLHEHVGADTRILDVGCGTGKVYEIVRGRMSSTAHVTMADISEEMCRRAREKTDGDARSRVVHGDPLADGDALGSGHDLATLLQVLHHVPDPGALLAAVRRLLRPGGVVVALCIGERYHEEVFDFVPDVHDAVGRRTLAEWRGLFESAGLEPVTVVEDLFQVTYRDVEAYRSFLDAVGVSRKINGYTDPSSIPIGAGPTVGDDPDGSLRLTGHHFTLTYRRPEEAQR